MQPWLLAPLVPQFCLLRVLGLWGCKARLLLWEHSHLWGARIYHLLPGTAGLHLHLTIRDSAEPFRSLQYTTGYVHNT